jgi:hypothetical protein
MRHEKYLKNGAVATWTTAFSAGRFDQGGVGVDEGHLTRREGPLETDLAVDLAV